MGFYHKIFLVLKVSFIFIYILVKLNILKTEPEIEYVIEDLLKAMVIIFCLYIFWPFRKKYQIKKEDRYFAFSAAIFLLTSFKILYKNSYWKALMNMLSMD